jgi:hypothetical protein
MSGDALISSQFSPSCVSAMLDCVRGVTRASPERASSQTKQRQFHWGTPPPAADPRMTVCTVSIGF